MQGRTIKLFLVEGSPTGILAAEIMNWTGHILVTPRSKIAEALKRPEAARTGVYLLIGDDPEHPSKLRVYVGEGDSVVDRIRAHAKDQNKEFWTHAFLVTSKDSNLTKAHVRYLESRLVELAKMAGRASVANGTEPAAKQLPESDVADMEFFLAQMQVVLPALGMDVLRPKTTTTVHASPTSSSGPTAGSHLELVLVNKKHGVEATAIESDGEVTVLSGSIATAKEFVSNNYGGLRETLINDASMIKQSESSYVFATDVIFPSPSAAAAVVLNRNSNGRVEWRLKATGQTLKEWQDAQLASVSIAAEEDDLPPAKLAGSAA